MIHRLQSSLLLKLLSVRSSKYVVKLAVNFSPNSWGASLQENEYLTPLVLMAEVWVEEAIFYYKVVNEAARYQSA